MHPQTIHPIREILALLAQDEAFCDSDSSLCDLLRIIRVAEHFQSRGGRDNDSVAPDTVSPH